MPIFPSQLKDNTIKTGVFNNCLSKIMDPLKHFSESGLQYKGYMVYPLLFAYLQDYPEGCKVNIWFFPYTRVVLHRTTEC